MQDFDFSILSDDQIVTLIKAACAECVRRGSAVEAAARDAMLTEAEKAQIASEAARRAAEKIKAEETLRIQREFEEKERQRLAQEETQKQIAEQKAKTERNWRKQRILGEMVQAVFGHGVTLTVWLKEGDKRVYLDKGDTRRPQVRVEYYVTGTGKYPAGKLLISGSETAPEKTEQDKEERRLVLQIVDRAAKDWNSLGKMDCDQAVTAKVETPEVLPAEFIAYRDDRVAKAEAAKAKAEAAQKERTEREARERAERDAAKAIELAEKQAKIRELVGGEPLLMLANVEREEKDYFNLLIVRIPETPDRFRLVAINVGNQGVRLLETLSESITLETIPSPWDEWIEAKSREKLADVVSMTEMSRDQVARYATSSTGVSFASRHLVWHDGSHYYQTPADRAKQAAKMQGVA